MNPIAQSLIIAVLGVVGFVPALLIWRRARKERAYAMQQLLMTRATTRMEKLLLAGKFTSGQHCHDQIFRAMSYAQCLDEAPRITIVNRTPEYDRLTAEIKAEIAEAGPEAETCINEFRSALVRACLISHPWTFRYYKFKVVLNAIAGRGKKKSVAKTFTRARPRHFGLMKALVAQAALVTMVATINQKPPGGDRDCAHAAGQPA